MRRRRVGEWILLVPENHRERARGLLGSAGLPPHEGLLLERCRSIHTFGMRFAIDAVLLDRHGRPIQIRSLPVGRVLLPRPGVRHVVEVAAGRGHAFAAALERGIIPP